MYSREQASLLKQEFWTIFGQYLAPVLSSEGLKTNWINYKTGLKYVYFKMDADKRKASISIEITHPDIGIQELFYEQFIEYKPMLTHYLKEEWEWELHTRNNQGTVISTIKTECSGVSIFNKSDWPKLISFYKPRIIALDEFWTDVKDGFESLR